MTKSQLIDWFETDFWPLYLELVKQPRLKNGKRFPTDFGAGDKGEAMKSMDRLNPSKDLRDRIMDHLAMQIEKRQELFERCGSKQVYEATVKYQKFYCNRHGKTWINNMGWFGEPPELTIKQAEPRQREPNLDGSDAKLGETWAQYKERKQMETR